MTHFTMKMLQVTYFVIRYECSRASHVRMMTLMALGAFRMRKKNKKSLFSGAPNENIVQNHLNIALVNVF